MRNGDVLLCLIFNAAVIFGLYFWQTRLLGRKLKRVKREIQELEDQVVAIIEEFSESVTETPAALQLKSEPPVKPQKKVVSNSAGKPHESTSLAKARPETNKSSSQASEVKQELIPPTRPKAKPKPKAKSKVKETFTTNSAGISGANPSARQVNPESGLQSPAEFSPPLAGTLESKRQMVLKLARQGMEIAEIARQLQMGQGEIQLILGLNKKS
jgi:hypothetical protein